VALWFKHREPNRKKARHSQVVSETVHLIVIAGKMECEAAFSDLENEPRLQAGACFKPVAFQSADTDARMERCGVLQAVAVVCIAAKGQSRLAPSAEICRRD
jgi:hypothetical protein